MKIPLREIEAVEKLPGRYSKIKVEQVLGMLRILERIQKEPALRERLALKGGSAINFFILEKIGRLSVDLDFDYIAPRETLKEAMCKLGSGLAYLPIEVKLWDLALFIA